MIVEKIDGENKFCGKFLHLFSSSKQLLNFYIQIYMELLVIYFLPPINAYGSKTNSSARRILIMQNRVMRHEPLLELRSLHILPQRDDHKKFWKD